MKNQTTKFNKSKLVARGMLLVFFLTNVVCFIGCDGYPDRKYILTVDYDGNWNMSQMQMIVTSDIKRFAKDDITFDLSYSMHYINSNGESSLYNSYDYYSSQVKKYDLIYGIYISDINDMWNSRHDGSLNIKDLASIEGNILIKQLNEEEALSEEYLRICPKFAVSANGGGDIYNHTETITIPKDLVDKNQGTFVISIIAFRWIEDSHIYSAFESSRIEFDYEEIDENTIEIDMDEWTVYFRIP